MSAASHTWQLFAVAAERTIVTRKSTSWLQPKLILAKQLANPLSVASCGVYDERAVISRSKWNVVPSGLVTCATFT